MGVWMRWTKKIKIKKRVKHTWIKIQNNTMMIKMMIALVVIKNVDEEDVFSHKKIPVVWGHLKHCHIVVAGLRWISDGGWNRCAAAPNGCRHCGNPLWRSKPGWGKVWVKGEVHQKGSERAYIHTTKKETKEPKNQRTKEPKEERKKGGEKTNGQKSIKKDQFFSKQSLTCFFVFEKIMAYHITRPHYKQGIDRRLIGQPWFAQGE